MKIYGGKDYYDCGLSMGIDPTITLVRGNSKTIPVEVAGGSLLNPRLQVTLPSMAQPGWNVAVVFCSKVYRGYLVSRSYGKNEGIWSADRARAFVSRFKDASIEFGTRWNEKKMTIEEYFAPFEASESLRKYMIANKISILVEKEDKWHREHPTFEVNPYTLKEIEFAKALDPWTAFQELSMWIGGVLGGTSPEICKITDDQVLIANHGYDKHSFRSSVRTA